MKYFIEASANLINLQDLIQFNLPFVETKVGEYSAKLEVNDLETAKHFLLSAANEHTKLPNGRDLETMMEEISLNFLRIGTVVAIILSEEQLAMSTVMKPDEETKFYPMSDYPTADQEHSQMSVDVLVFIQGKDKIVSTSGYYSFTDKMWRCSDAKNAKCWCYIPDPMQYLDKQV